MSDARSRPDAPDRAGLPSGRRTPPGSGLGRAALGVVAAIGDLVLPGSCAGCGVAGTAALCGRCLSAFPELAGRCRPRSPPPGLPPVWAAAGYRGEVRAALLAYKERSRRSLSRPLGRALGRALQEAVSSCDPAGGRLVLVVPVPSSRSAVRARGHDHARGLARAAVAQARRGGVPARLAPLLTHARRTQDQAGLGRAARADNMRGALAVRPPGRRPGGRRSMPLLWIREGALVVLVDDVLTTGATLAESARALRAAGIRVDAAAVLAATAARERSWWADPQGTSVPSWHPSGSVVAPSAPSRQGVRRG